MCDPKGQGVHFKEKKLEGFSELGLIPSKNIFETGGCMSSSYLSGRTCRVVKTSIVAYEGEVSEEYVGVWCDLLRLDTGEFRVLVLTNEFGLKIERLQDVFVD